MLFNTYLYIVLEAVFRDSEIQTQRIIHLYSLSSERLVDIKITKFYAEKVVHSARKI
jgi:hypothetical protein